MLRLADRPFPGNLIYHLAARHVEAVGAFYRLVPVGPAGAPGEG